MKEFYSKYKYTINRIIFILGFFLFVYIFFNYIFTLIAPFVIGYIFSLILNPIADFISKKINAPRWFSAMFCLILIIFVISVFGSKLFSRIFSEARLFIQNVPIFVNQFTTMASNLGDKYSDIFEFMPERYRMYFDQILTSLVGSVSSAAGTMFKDNSINIVSKIPNMLMIILLTLISTFFFISDKELIAESIGKYTPAVIKNNMLKVRKGVFSALTGYIKAQAIIMCMTGTIAIIVLSILKYEYAMFVGLVIALVDALPIFGSGFILWPWIAISFFSSDFRMAIGLLILYGLILLTRQIAEPKVLGTQIGMHPLVTLMSMYVGLRIFGMFGFIIGPVVVIIIKSLLKAEDEIMQQ